MRVLIAVVPLAGHVGPLTGLTEALLAGGHEVMAYTGRRHAEAFSRLGAEIAPWVEAPDFDENDLAATFDIPRRPGLLQTIANVQTVFLGTAAAQCRDLLAVLDRWPADVLVSDLLTYGGTFAGEVTGMPWVSVSVVPFGYPSAELPPPGMPLPPARGPLGRGRDRVLHQTLRLMSRGIDRRFNTARAEVGLPAVDRLLGEAMISPWLTLATGTPSMEHPRSDLPASVHFVGRIAPAGHRAGAVTPPPRSDRPRVVVTQGTYDTDPHDLLIPAARGLADLDADVWLTTGVPGRRRLGVDLPDHLHVVEFLDYPATLPGTDVMITNGGWGGVLAGLAAGVPLVVAGGTIDKPEIANRVARCGAGIDLGTGHPSPRAVARAVTTVLGDPAYARRARELAAELSALGGTPTAVALIERLAADRTPVLRTRSPWV